MNYTKKLRQRVVEVLFKHPAITDLLNLKFQPMSENMKMALTGKGIESTCFILGDVFYYDPDFISQLSDDQIDYLLVYKTLQKQLFQLVRLEYLREHENVDINTWFLAMNLVNDSICETMELRRIPKDEEYLELLAQTDNKSVEVVYQLLKSEEPDQEIISVNIPKDTLEEDQSDDSDSQDSTSKSKNENADEDTDDNDSNEQSSADEDDPEEADEDESQNSCGKSDQDSEENKNQDDTDSDDGDSSDSADDEENRQSEHSSDSNQNQNQKSGDAESQSRDQNKSEQDQSDQEQGSGSNQQSNNPNNDVENNIELLAHRWDLMALEKDESPITPEEKGELLNKLEQLQEHLKDIGHYPGSLVKTLVNLTKSTFHVASFIRRLITINKFRNDWTRPNKRFLDQDIIIPTKRGQELNITLVIDVSGSISPEELGKFKHLAKEILMQKIDKVEMAVCTWDVVAHEFRYVTKPEDLEKLEFYGGGGTNFSDVFNFLKTVIKNTIKNKIVIIMTDGFMYRWPSKESSKDFKVIWMFVHPDYYYFVQNYAKNALANHEIIELFKFKWY